MTGSKRQGKINSFLRDKYIEMSCDFAKSTLNMYKTDSKIVFFIFFLLDILILTHLQIQFNFIKILVLIIIIIILPSSVYFWISCSLINNNKASTQLLFNFKFSISYCYEKLIKSKEVLEQVLFENNPFQRLEENRLYRQIIKASPIMKIVFKVMLENSYWHYDGFNIIQTEKCTRQVIGKLATDSDLGININFNWHIPCQKLMLLSKPLYAYNKGKDDKTWNEIKQLIIAELEK